MESTIAVINAVSANVSVIRVLYLMVERGWRLIVLYEETFEASASRGVRFTRSFPYWLLAGAARLALLALVR